MIYIPYDILNIIFNYLNVLSIYSASCSSKYFEHFINNIFMMENYYESFCDMNLIKKHIKYIKSIQINGVNEMNDDDLKYIYENGPNIDKLILPNNNKITDEGLKFINNINTLDLSNNLKITSLCLQYLKGIQTLKIFNYSMWWGSNYNGAISSFYPFEYFNNINGINSLYIKDINENIIKYLIGIKNLVCKFFSVDNKYLYYLKNINKLIINEKIFNINYLGLKSILCDKCQNNIYTNHDDTRCLQELILPDNIDAFDDNFMRLLKYIKILKIPGSNLSIDGILKLENVKELYLNEQRSLVDQDIDKIATHLIKLKILDIKNNKKITLNGILKLKNIDKLILSSKYKSYEDEILKSTKIKKLEFFF